jgi:integrase
MYIDGEARALFCRVRLEIDTSTGQATEEIGYVRKAVVEKNIRPFFGKIRAVKLTTDRMDAYRAKRKAEGRTDATANRELSIVRTAFNNARKRTPPKVNLVPYFPMIEETTVRQGYLADKVYARLPDELPQYLKAIFVCGYVTGMRKNELAKIQWDQLEFDAGLITLENYRSKRKDPHTVPILAGDMHDLLMANREDRQANRPLSPWVFSLDGIPLKDFRTSWKHTCERAGVPKLQFHDMRRTAVRNMRRAGVPQLIRMAISGHKTDSMERRYNIVDGEDLSIAKELMERRLKPAVTASGGGKQKTA